MAIFTSILEGAKTAKNGTKRADVSMVWLKFEEAGLFGRPLEGAADVFLVVLYESSN